MPDSAVGVDANIHTSIVCINMWSDDLVHRCPRRLRHLRRSSTAVLMPRVNVWLRIPAKLTDESDDDDRVESCGAWSLDFSVVGQHRG